MKKSIPITLLLAILSVFAGCGVDATTELTKIDTLLQSRPDSAYARLQAIEPADLSSTNRAYYALLLTTAQYKNYVTIESDSVIDIAVDYYSANPEGAKLTQALMYNGAVLAEMNLSKEALDYYKRAEQMADTTDFLVMGWINTRMGELYEKTYIENQEDIKRYKIALKYYKKSQNRRYENFILGKLGLLYTIPNRDSAFYYINSAITLSTARCDSTQLYYDFNILAAAHRYYQNHQTVLDICRNIPPKFRQNSDYYRFITTAYAKLGKVDSAEIFVKYIEPQTAEQRVSYLMALEDIAVAKGDYKAAHEYSEVYNELSDSIIRVAKQHELFNIDKRLDNQFAKNRAVQLEKDNRVQLYVIALASTVIISLILLTYFIILNNRKRREQQEQFISQLQTDLELQQLKTAEMSRNLDLKPEIKERLINILDGRTQMIKQIMAISFAHGDNGERFVKHFNKFVEENRQSPEAATQIIETANLLHNNVIDYIKNHYDKLTSNDLLLLSLTSLEFSAAEICVYMGYSSINVMSSLRTRLMRSKIGMQISILDFIKQMTEEALK